MSQSTLGELTGTVTDALSDAWSTSSTLAHELASTAADQVGTASDAVVSLVDSAREKVHPTRRRRFNPWFLVAVALVGAVAAGWMLKRRRAADAVADHEATSVLGDYRAAAG